MDIDKNVISNFAARAIILKLLGCGSFKNDVTTGSKGRRLKKMVTKKDKGGRGYSIWWRHLFRFWYWSFILFIEICNS